MNRSKLAVPIIASMLAFASMGTAGCTVEERVVVKQPPQDRDDTPHETVARPPTREHMWIRGHWQWNGNDYVWVPGHWETRRVGYEWVAGHWERYRHGWVWREGHWDRR